jgi:hypothetical protein
MSSSDSGDMRVTTLLSLPHALESCRRQAMKANVSCFDVAALCDSQYHGGPNGLSILTIPDIHAYGYMSITSNNVMLCFNDIISMHSKVLASWMNTHTQHSGPSIQRIVKKAIPAILPKLNGLTSVELVLFYDNLQKNSSVYLLLLMPFDAINLRLGFEGLCPPGLGTHCYAVICKAMMEIFPCLLPSFSHVTMAISTTRVENGNGYALLWEIMALSVPGFDPTLHVLALVWEDFLDILNFGHAHILYFHLQAKIGLFYDSCKKSCTFLWAIQYNEYVNVVTLLQTSVETFQDPYDKGYLPTHLCLMSLAQRLDKNWRYHVRKVIPCVRCIQGVGYHFGFGYDDHGYNPQVYCTNIGGRGCDTRGYDDRFDGGHGLDTWGTDHADGCPRYPAHGRDLVNWGCYACPDHNRRMFDQDLQCDTCKHVGHAAGMCDMLAQVLFLAKYVKTLLDDRAREKLEMAWLDCWHAQLGKPLHTPCTFMRAYLDEMAMTLEDLDAQMCWDCWPGDAPSKTWNSLTLND